MVTVVTIFGLEILASLGLIRSHTLYKRRQLLLYGIDQPKALPLIDSRLEKMAGTLSKREERVSKFAVKNIRRLVNTQAFEYIVRGWINPRSRMRSGLNRIDKFRKKLGLGL